MKLLPKVGIQSSSCLQGSLTIQHTQERDWGARLGMALSPGFLPPLCFFYLFFFTCMIIINAKFACMSKQRAWAALITCGQWWRVQCPMCTRIWVQKNKKDTQISVFLGFLGCSTDGFIVGQDSQLNSDGSRELTAAINYDHSLSFKTTRH